MSAEPSADVSQIRDEDVLRRMWQDASDFGRKKEIRAHMYKLREARLCDLYNTGEVTAQTQNTTSKIMRTSGTTTKVSSSSHADSLADHSFISMKTKEIRDSESPTRDVSYRAITSNDTALSNQGWNVVSTNEKSNDGKTYSTSKIATKSGTERIDNGKLDYAAENAQKTTIHQDGDERNFVKAVGAESSSIIRQEAVGGDENSNFKTSSTSTTSSSRYVTEQKSSQEVPSGATNLKLTYHEDNIPLELKNHPSYVEGKTKVTKETKTLADGSMVTTTRYEIKGGNTTSKSSSEQTSSEFQSRTSENRNQNSRTTKYVDNWTPETGGTTAMTVHDSELVPARTVQDSTSSRTTIIKNTKVEPQITQSSTTITSNQFEVEAPKVERNQTVKTTVIRNVDDFRSEPTPKQVPKEQYVQSERQQVNVDYYRSEPSPKQEPKEQYEQPERRQPFKPSKGELNDKNQPTDGQYDTTYRTDFTNKKISVELSANHQAFASSLRAVSPDRLTRNRSNRSSTSSLRNSTSPEKNRHPSRYSPERRRATSPKKTISTETITYTNRKDENLRRDVTKVDSSTLTRRKPKARSPSPTSTVTTGTDFEFYRNTDVVTDLDTNETIIVTKSRPSSLDIGKRTKKVTERSPTSPLEVRKSTSPRRSSLKVSPSKEVPKREPVREDRPLKRTDTYEERCRQILGLGESERRRSSLDRLTIRRGSGSKVEKKEIVVNGRKSPEKKVERYISSQKEIVPGSKKPNGVCEVPSKVRKSPEKLSSNKTKIGEFPAQVRKSPQKELFEAYPEKKKPYSSPNQLNEFPSQIRKSPTKEPLADYPEKRSPSSDKPTIAEFPSQIRKSPEREPLEAYPEKKKPYSSPNQLNEFPSQIKKSPTKEPLPDYPEKRRPSSDKPTIAEFPSQIRKSPEREPLEAYPEKKKPYSSPNQLNEFPSQIKKSPTKEPLPDYPKKRRPSSDKPTIAEFPSQIRKSPEREPLEAYPEKKKPYSSPNQLNEFPSQIKKSPTKEPLPDYPKKRRPSSDKPTIAEFPSQIRKSPEREPLEAYPEKKKPYSSPNQLNEFPSQIKKSPTKEPLPDYPKKRRPSSDKPTIAEFPSQIRKSPEREPLEAYPEKKKPYSSPNQLNEFPSQIKKSPTKEPLPDYPEKRRPNSDKPSIAEFPSQICKSPEREPLEAYPEKKNLYSSPNQLNEFPSQIKKSPTKEPLPDYPEKRHPSSDKPSIAEFPSQIRKSPEREPLEAYPEKKKPYSSPNQLNEFPSQIKKSPTKEPLPNYPEKRRPSSDKPTIAEFPSQIRKSLEKYQKPKPRTESSSTDEEEDISQITTITELETRVPVKEPPFTKRFISKLGEDEEEERIDSRRTTMTELEAEIIRPEKIQQSVKKDLSRLTSSKDFIEIEKKDTDASKRQVKKPLVEKNSNSTTKKVTSVSTLKKNVDEKTNRVKTTKHISLQNLENVNRKVITNGDVKKLKKPVSKVEEPLKSPPSKKPTVTITSRIETSETKRTSQVTPKRHVATVTITPKPKPTLKSVTKTSTTHKVSNESLLDGLEEQTTTKMARTTSDRIIRHKKPLQPVRNASKPELQTKKKCITTKTITVNSDSKKEVTVNLQRSVSSREPTPDRVGAHPTSSDEEESPRYPDKITEPEDGRSPRRGNKTAPILEGTTEEFTSIVEITGDVNKVDETDESLLSVDKKIYKFLNQTDQEVKKTGPAPKQSRASFVVEDNLKSDECLLSVSEKVNKFITTAEQLTTAPDGTQRPKSPKCQYYTEDVNVSDKVQHFITTAEEMVTKKQPVRTSISKEAPSVNLTSDRLEKQPVSLSNLESTRSSKEPSPERRTSLKSSPEPQITRRGSSPKPVDTTPLSSRRPSNEIKLKSTESVKRAKALFETINQEQKPKQRDILSRPSVFEARRHEPRAQSPEVEPSLLKEVLNGDVPGYMKPLDRSLRPHSPHRETKKVEEVEEGRKTKFGVTLRRTDSGRVINGKTIILTKTEFDNITEEEIETIYSLEVLDELLEKVTNYEIRRKIRTQIRIVKKLIQEGKLTTKTSQKTGTSEYQSSYNYNERRTSSETKTTTRTSSKSPERKVNENGLRISQTVETSTTRSGSKSPERRFKPSPERATITETRTRTSSKSPERKVKESGSRMSQTVEVSRTRGTSKSPERRFKPNSERTTSTVTETRTRTSGKSPEQRVKNNDSIMSRTVEVNSARSTSKSPERRFKASSERTTSSVTETRTSTSSYEQNSSQVRANKSPERKYSRDKSPEKVSSTKSTKLFTTQLKKTTPIKPAVESSVPEWVKARNLKKPIEKNKTVTTSSSATSTTTSSVKKTRTSPVKEIKPTDTITSSYGVGPTDENGTPLFGLKALRASNKAETTKVQGTVVRSEYYSENGAEPIGEISVTKYSTDPRDLGRTSPTKGISSVTTRQKFGYKDTPSLKTLTSTKKVKEVCDRRRSSTEIDETKSKLTRRSSVKAISQKFIDNAVESVKSERQAPYPKAGLILRTSSFKDSNSSDEQSREGSNERTVTVRTSTSTTGSFLSNKSKVSGMQDVITRMKSEEVQEGDSREDVEARSLLNKFIGSQVILTGLEEGSRTHHEQQKRTTKITTTITENGKPKTITRVFQHPINEGDLDKIWDEQTLRLLLEQSTDYEERRRIRARLRHVMAEQEACAELVEQASSQQEQQSTFEGVNESKQTVTEGPVTTTQTSTRVTTQTQQVVKKPISPFAKFRQLDKQNSQTTPPSTPKTPSGSGPLFKFTDPALTQSASTIKERLLHWCRMKTKEYENIQLDNFSTSWADGLAFCALVHHFLPDAFDYQALTSKNRRHNFTLAFQVADEKADIAPLLDVDDMVATRKPDWKCVFTYVQSIYRRFKDED